jgi:hypothetical protein
VGQKKDIHARCDDLRHRNAALRARAAAAREMSVRIQRQVVAQPAPTPALGGAVYDVPPDSHDLALEALRLIRTIIDPFPIEWQVAIVKALTARTIVLTRERMQTPPPTALSA